MKKIRLLPLFFGIIFASSLFTADSANAFSRKKHDEYMLKVLFRDDGLKYGQSDEIEMLESACYLAIDQFNGSGNEELEFLKKHDVKGIPKKISDINFTDNSHHRLKTHRGWSATENKYPDWVNSDRRAIMNKTVTQVFDFGNDTKKADSFCALLYYIHILGDHQHYVEENRETQKYNNYDVIQVGGRNDDLDIISELQKHLKILFADQKFSFKYYSLTNTLSQYDGKYKELLHSNGGGDINSPEKFDQHAEYLKELMNYLSKTIPVMLEREKFFNEVFK